MERLVSHMLLEPVKLATLITTWNYPFVCFGDGSFVTQTALKLTVYLRVSVNSRSSLCYLPNSGVTNTLS